MASLIKAELIKGKRSFGRKSIIILPLFAAVMAIVLMGGRLVQVGAANWWYMVLMPCVIALICVNLIGPEKRQQYFNLLSLPQPKTQVWRAKIVTGCASLFAANLIVFGLTAITGVLFDAQYPFWSGLAAALVLTVTCAWQIPVGMFLASKLSSGFTLVVILLVNVFFSTQIFAGSNLWLIPFSIPARLMAPILGVNPNGVLLSPGEALLDSGVILPGILIAVALFTVSSVATSIWFSRKGD